MLSSHKNVTVLILNKINCINKNVPFSTIQGTEPELQVDCSNPQS